MSANDDLHTEFTEINARLQQLHNDHGQLFGINEATKASTDAVGQGVQTLIALQSYANEALTHLIKQQDTVICILEKVSERTCALLNEAHTQTGLQTSLQQDSALLVEMYKTVHPDAALEQERIEKLRQQMLACCPPEPPQPICIYMPCPAPGPLRDRPSPPEPPR